MGQKENILEVTLATALMIGAIGVFCFVGYKHYRGFDRSTTFQAEFDSVGGLNEGSPVKVNGVTMGTVRSIRLDSKRNFAAIVTFSLSSKLRLPSDTQASIVSESLLGSKVMTLSPGTSSSLLSEGETIYQTQSPMNVEDLIQKFFFSHSESEPKQQEETKGEL